MTSSTAAFLPREHCLPDQQALVAALADAIAAVLERRLGSGRAASLLVPGGKTPTVLFDRLCQIELDWSNVWIGLTDERWVAAGNDMSNEHLVRRHLLRNHAAHANFVGLHNREPTAARGAAAAWSAMAEMPRPFDFVLLGMGDDGHFASLFPHGANLAEGLDLTAHPGCLASVAPVAPEERMTLNLRALVDAHHIALLTVGAGKWATYQKARERGAVVDMPVRALTQQQNVPVDLYWSP